MSFADLPEFSRLLTLREPIAVIGNRGEIVESRHLFVGDGDYCSIPAKIIAFRDADNEIVKLHAPMFVVLSRDTVVYEASYPVVRAAHQD